MNKLFAMAALAAAGVTSSVFAQTNTPDPAGYHFEFRIIADGDVGAPTGPGSVFNLSPTATRIGFWLQARVSQTVNENWGITRVSAPAAPETSFLTVTDAVGSSLNRGSVNAANTFFGRGSGYRNGGPATGATGNSGTSVAFPGITGNENGGLDQNNTRIFSFDSYVGSTRPANQDTLNNPWNVNGASGEGSALPSDGSFSPWASVYRFVVLPTNVNSQRAITLNAFAMIQGASAAHPTDESLASWAMEVGPGRNMSATYTFTWGIPTPGAAALMGMGMLAAGRRRR